MQIAVALERFFNFFAKNSWIAIVWTLVILTVCTWPGKDIPNPPFPNFDKLVHGGMFVVWAVLWLLCYPNKSKLIILLGMAYGLGIEFYQQILPFDRTFDWWDAVADSVGVFLGYGFKTLVLDRYLQRLY